MPPIRRRLGAISWFLIGAFEYDKIATVSSRSVACGRFIPLRTARAVRCQPGARIRQNRLDFRSMVRSDQSVSTALVEGGPRTIMAAAQEPRRERCGGLLTAFFAARRASAKSGWRLIIGAMMRPTAW
jgi:hypothetical protein